MSAALSVPAVFLALWGEGVWSVVGSWANGTAGLVLWAEWILLIVLAEDKPGWLRIHRWSTFVAAILIDPTSPARRFLADPPVHFDPWKFLLASVLIAIAAALIIAIGRRGAQNAKGPGTESSDGSEALDDDSTQSP